MRIPRFKYVDGGETVPSSGVSNFSLRRGGRELARELGTGDVRRGCEACGCVGRTFSMFHDVHSFKSAGSTSA